MNSLSVTDYISLMYNYITEIFEKKIELSIQPNTTLVNNKDKDLFNDSIRFYEFILKTIESVKYNFSLLKESRYKSLLEDIESLNYFNEIIKCSQRRKK